VTLTVDLLTLKVVSESRETLATSVPFLVFLGLSVLDLGPMYATDRETSDVRQHHRLMPPPIMGGSIIIVDEQKNLPRFDVDQLHYVKLRVCTDPGI